MAGFIAFDAGTHEEARRVFRFALGGAEQAGDWHLRAAILADMARQAIRTGQPDEGLTYSEHALVRADRLTPTEQAMLNPAATPRRQHRPAGQGNHNVDRRN